jgi:hypothetical protein
MSHTYFVLEPLRDTEAIAVHIHEPLCARLTAGEKLQQEISQLELEVVNPEASLFDLVDNEAGVLVASPDFCAILEHNEVRSIEFIPALLKHADGTIRADDFFVVNVRQCVAALDERRSEWEAKNGSVGRIERAVLDDSIAVTGPPLLRLAERKDLVLVRDDLLTAMQAAGLAGVDATPLAQFRG